jgi:hypothetical protein
MKSVPYLNAVSDIDYSALLVLDVNSLRIQIKCHTQMKEGGGETADVHRERCT